MGIRNVPLLKLMLAVWTPRAAGVNVTAKE
jgi:hypothetical protein